MRFIAHSETSNNSEHSSDSGVGVGIGISFCSTHFNPDTDPDLEPST